MPKKLTSEQIKQFNRDGYLFPIRVMSEEAVKAFRNKLEDFERKAGGPLSGDLRFKTHLLFLGCVI
jgi:non-heme Fe2+,alpha-ketoglutarate-dependent halogenase